MCGLYGIINKFSQSQFIPAEIEGFMDMAKLTALRGDHSSGVWGIFKKNPTRLPLVLKTVGDPYNLLHREETYKQIISGMKNDFCAMFGHGRKATSGKITYENAHPFVHKNIVLAHNGMINGAKLNEEVDVDSHALTIEVQQKGIMETLETVSGAWAIIAYDMNKAKILIARNNARPLHYAEANDMIYIMSDKKALEYYLDRINRTTVPIKEFEANHLYEIDPLNASLDPKEIKREPIWTNWKGTKINDSETYLPIPHNGTALYRTDDKNWELKKGSDVEFLVERCIHNAENGQNYRYECSDEENHPIVFHSHNQELDLVGKIGVGKILSAVRPKGWRHGDDSKPIAYFVKKRDIKWVTSREASAANDDDETPELTSKNNITLDIDAWELHIKGAECSQCKVPVQIGDIPDTVTIYDEQGGFEFLCSGCIHFLTEQHLKELGVANGNSTL